MKAKFVRTETQEYIEIEMPHGKEYLWYGLIEFSARKLSINELKKVYEECNKQFLKMNPDDVPLVFREILAELQQTIVNRKAYE